MDRPLRFIQRIVHFYSNDRLLWPKTVYFDSEPSTFAQKTVHYLSGPSTLAQNDVILVDIMVIKVEIRAIFVAITVIWLDWKVILKSKRSFWKTKFSKNFKSVHYSSWQSDSNIEHNFMTYFCSPRDLFYKVSLFFFLSVLKKNRRRNDFLFNGVFWLVGRDQFYDCGLSMSWDCFFITLNREK